MTFIDCQCHLGVPVLADLFPFIEGAWVDRLVRTEFQLPNPARHPGHFEDLPTGFAPAELSDSLAEDLKAAILIPHQTMPVAGWCDTKLNAVYASAINQYAEAHWLPADAHFHLAGAISPQEPEAAVTEIRRLAANPRVAAISMPLLGINLGQSHYRPILTAAAEHGLPLIIHPSGTEGLVVGGPALGGTGPRRTEERYGLLPQVAVTNILSLIFGGVFVELPNLRVIFADVGFDWAPSLVWRMDSEWRSFSVDVPWITEAPSNFLGRNIRLVVDDLGAAPPAITRHLAGLLPPTLLMYGSNAPFSHMTRDAVLDGIPDDLQGRFSMDNGKETFRLTWSH